MAYTVWTQDNFTKGELSPFMYGRTGNQHYYEGLQIAQNTLSYPTGAIGKRFGTLYNATLSNITTGLDFFFQTFQYLDQCTYQLVFTAGTLYIYLEGILTNTVSIPYDAVSVYNLNTTVLTNSSGAIFRVCCPNFHPYDLTRASGSTFTITGVGSNLFTVSPSTLGTGEILPLVFTTSGSLPTTTPQILLNKVYFAFLNTTSTLSIYGSAVDAANQTNAFTLTNAGTGTNNIVFQNSWSFTQTVWKNLPFYDFTDGYDAITFTPSAGIGTSVTLTASSSIFTAAHVGGAFFGNGGAARILTVASGTSATIAISIPFVSTSSIQGSLCLLAEPAWSATRGWPNKASSYQNRAVFANTSLLPNGFWASVINDYTDFGDLTTDDDDAISWFPSSGNINVINFIVPFRSLTVHTNSGVYSNPLSEVNAITPTSFTLQLQDTTPAQVLEPQAIDNQILILAGNDLHTMLWDGINNAYTSNIVSVINEQTIRNPVDQIAYANLNRSGSRYVFIINSNGSMAVYQTLQSEAISGLTPQITQQSYGNASFLQAASSFDGRAWFVCARDIATAHTGISISAFTSSTLTATASNLSTTIPTAITFTTTGTLPASTPALTTTQYYWAIGVTADTFNVYASQEDALAGTNQFVFTSAGTSSKLVAWPLVKNFTLEELSNDVKLDCAFFFNNNGSPTSTITTGALFNAQDVAMIGDNFGFTGTGFNNQVVFNAKGVPQAVNEGYIGFPINTIIQPMPLALPPGSQSSLTKPVNIRSARFWFNNTIGGTINGVNVALNSFANAHIGEPPIPSNGYFELMVMPGWDLIKYPAFVIEHSEPFDIQLLSISYSAEV